MQYLLKSLPTSKRQRVDELSDTDTSESSKDGSDTLLKEGEKTSLTQELKDNLLDTIANNLHADGQTDQDVFDKLANSLIRD